MGRGRKTLGECLKDDMKVLVLCLKGQYLEMCEGTLYMGQTVQP